MSDMTDLDPTIAALLAEASANQQDDSAADFDDFEVGNASGSSFKTLSDQMDFGEDKDESVPSVDLSVTHFQTIEKLFEDEPHHYFDDKTYYKTALTGEGDASQRVHQILSRYLVCQDPKDRTVYRQQLVTAYWELVRTIVPKMTNPNVPMPKKMLLRFAVVLPSLFTPEQKLTFSTAFLKNSTKEPVYYLDEWFKEIGTGHISLSATDESRPKKSANNTGTADQQHLRQLKGKNDGKLQNAENMLNAKESERNMLEIELRNRVEALCEHPACMGMDNHRMPYSEGQKRMFAEIQEKLRALQKNDRELGNYLKEVEEAKAIENSLSAKMTDVPDDIEVSHSDLMTEMNTVRQMAKMTVGRQGNQFPVFTREFYHGTPKGTGFRENVINMLAWIESLDPGAYVRVHRQINNRIVPYVILVPTYGDFGICWEPFDRYNRVTSRGRIVIPMYPRDLKIAMLMAVADLRWQVAKEKASYYWMEEGLTGQYYQWIEDQKLKGDLKAYFISDYVLWMTKEANGTQVMDKKLRAIFWRFIPFPQEKKDELKKRSMVYAELYQRDLNRAMSDGY
ncbi:MAG: hypothetical protein IJP62_04375 [Treponema sp.]|nr:hypothetical protein [Treponema sp.]